MKEYLENFAFFEFLNPEELNYVVQNMDSLELNIGEILFEEGDEGDFVCFIFDGALEVVKYSTNLDEAEVITVLAQGNTVGEMALVNHDLRSATIRAVSNTHLAVLTQRSFEAILDENPKIGINLLKGLTLVLHDNLRETTASLADALAA